MATQTLTQMDLKHPREHLKPSDAGWRRLDHDAYYASAEDLVSAGLVRPEQLPGAKGTGFSFDESAIADFDDLVLDIRELLSHAVIQFDGRWQQKVVSECKAHIAKADTGFQSALARMQSAS